MAVTKAKLLESNVELLSSRFYVDGSSGSGLRMKIPNSARNPKIIRKAGDVAGFIGHDARGKPRWEIGIQEVYVKVSRIIWILVNGSIPDGLIIDHKDGNPLNNQLDNLQLLSNPQNLRALNSPYKCNTSGFLGVFTRGNNSWYAAMRRQGKLRSLGTFSTKIAAAKAYNNAVIKWAEEHGETPRYPNPV